MVKLGSCSNRFKQLHTCQFFSRLECMALFTSLSYRDFLINLMAVISLGDDIARYFVGCFCLGGVCATYGLR